VVGNEALDAGAIVGQTQLGKKRMEMVDGLVHGLAHFPSSARAMPWPPAWHRLTMKRLPLSCISSCLAFMWSLLEKVGMSLLFRGCSRKQIQQLHQAMHFAMGCILSDGAVLGLVNSQCARRHRLAGGKTAQLGARTGCIRKIRYSMMKMTSITI
jgi:hypothetical protein